MHVHERRQSSGEHQLRIGFVLSAGLRIPTKEINQKSELEMNWAWNGVNVCSGAVLNARKFSEIGCIKVLYLFFSFLEKKNKTKNNSNKMRSKIRNG